MKSWRASKTIRWGHIQMAAGLLATVLPFITPEAFPELPLWVFGSVSMLAAAITYWLRARTYGALRRGRTRQRDEDIA